MALSRERVGCRLHDADNAVDRKVFYAVVARLKALAFNGRHHVTRLHTDTDQSDSPTAMKLSPSWLTADELIVLA